MSSKPNRLTKNLLQPTSYTTPSANVTQVSARLAIYVLVMRGCSKLNPCKRPIQSAHFFFWWAFGPLPNQFLANGIECRWGLNPGLPAARLPPGPGFLLEFLECQDLQALCHRLCGHPDVEAGE